MFKWFSMQEGLILISYSYIFVQQKKKDICNNKRNSSFVGCNTPTSFATKKSKNVYI